ncbi:putative PurR-regulated permease PerM [Clostridium pascui]|uniref:AI-2E family transporter n=1 Tax=Clostridium pascui TaxID=46609 RepID=UPI001959458B|nr:AI-2E family transporter [Clostridium pascui]MBM7868823.1 putative PurR-regulated permease PerM [Clostridium pascui]
MLEVVKKYKKVFLVAFIFILAFTLLLKVKFIRDMFNLIFVSFILFYVFKPFRDMLMNKGLGRKVSSLIIMFIVVTVFASIFIFIIPSIIKESLNLYDSLKNLGNYTNRIYENIKINRGIAYSITQNIYIRGSKAFEVFLNSWINKALTFGENLLSIAIIPIIAYYFLSDSLKLKNRFLALFPIQSRNIIDKILEDTDRILSRYVITQFLLCFIIGVCTFIVLITFKVQFSLTLSLLNAFFNIIPYFGPIFGAIPAIVMALLKSPQAALWVAFWLYLIQQVEGDFISPKFIGDNISMHPLAVILILVIGGKVGGFFGMVLAVPVGVVAKVIYEDLNYYMF